MLNTGRGLRVFKYEALGNSYLVLDPRFAGAALERFKIIIRGVGWPVSSLVRNLCDVSVGVGSNGLLFGPLASSCDDRFGLLIINSDGTSAGFSGNGTRIFAQYLIDSGDAQLGQTVQLEITEVSKDTSGALNIAIAHLPTHPDQPIRITAPHTPQFGAKAVAASPELIRLPDENSGKPPRYSLPALAKVGHEITGSPSAWATSVLVEIGNPHCVTFVSKIEQLPDHSTLQVHSPTLKTIAFRGCSPEPIFANGINLQWAWAESRRVLRLAIYERSEGPTLASGSSACAAACAAYALKLIDRDVEVIMPGGKLAISLDGSPRDITTVTLSGFARRIFEGMVYAT